MNKKIIWAFVGLLIWVWLSFFLKPIIMGSPLINSEGKPLTETSSGKVATNTWKTNGTWSLKVNTGSVLTNTGSQIEISRENIFYVLYLWAPISEKIPNGMISLLKINKEKKTVDIYSFAYNMLTKNKKWVYSLMWWIYDLEMKEILEEKLGIKIAYIEDNLAIKRGILEYYTYLIQPNGYLVTIDGEQKPIKNEGALLTYMTLVWFYDVDQVQTFQNNLIKTLWISSIKDRKMKDLFKNKEIYSLLEINFKDSWITWDEKKINIVQNDTRYVRGFDYEQRPWFVYEDGEDSFWNLIKTVISK